MLDPKLLRQNGEWVQKNLRRRGFELDLASFEQLDNKRKQIQNKTQELQALRNKVSKQIGAAKALGQDVTEILRQVENLGGELKTCEQELEFVQQELLDFQLNIPNLLADSVPEGSKEEDAVEIKKQGDLPNFNFAVKDHVDVGQELGLIDFEAAANLSGARFVVLKSGLAKLQRALGQFMLDLHLNQHGYQEVYVPYLVHETALLGTGQLPKFSADLFKIMANPDFYLIPTAEVSLTNLVRERIIPLEQLPLKFVAQTPCFRSEAGSYGKDTRGMIRVHQFEKVELVQVVEPESSYQALEELVHHAERVLQLLELPYRIIVLSAGDTGFHAAKTYDLEVWLPAQKRYREISSCSNCEAFQARRMQARYRSNNMEKPELVHTLNGSGVAIGRALVAIMENYQNADGSITIPTVLRSYMGGLEKIDVHSNTVMVNQ